MANIQEVDYQAIPGVAANIEGKGSEMNSVVSKAYSEVDGLRATWHGLRYNTLIALFNDISVSVNELLKLVVVEIPTALSQVAQNYANAEGTSVSVTNGGAVTNVPTLSDSNAETLAFNSADAEGVRNSVKGYFVQASDLMEQAQSDFNSLNWNSDAAQAFKNKMAQLTSQITSAFTNINTQFSTLMTEAQQDIEAAESSNTVE